MVNHLGLGFFPFARRYLGNRIFFLFLRVLRCFSSPGSPPYTMYSCMDTWALPQAGFPIRKSLDQRLLAPPQSLSQLTTSFIGSQRQGIHPTLFLTWPFHFLRENVTFYYLKSALADLIRIVYDMQFSMCKAQYLLCKWEMNSQDWIVNQFLPRKEVIQPHLPIRLPCYDFTPVIEFTLGSLPRKVG